jgi:hypothetical protein
MDPKVLSLATAKLPKAPKAHLLATSLDQLPVVRKPTRYQDVEASKPLTASDPSNASSQHMAHAQESRWMRMVAISNAIAKPSINTTTTTTTATTTTTSAQTENRSAMSGAGSSTNLRTAHRGLAPSTPARMGTRIQGALLESLGLASLIKNNQLSRHEVFTHLLERNTVQALYLLQRNLNLSFADACNAQMAMHQTQACTAYLGSLLRELRHAGQGLCNRRDQMLCALLEAGLSYSSSLNFMTLRDHLFAECFLKPGCFEQQFRLAVAVHLSRLTSQAWPAAEQELALPFFTKEFRREVSGLRELGRAVLSDAVEQTVKTLAAEPKGGSDSSSSDLSLGLQQVVGLSAAMAQLLAGACRRNNTSSSADMGPAMRWALQSAPAPQFNANDPVSIWELACRDIVGLVCMRFSMNSTPQ